jgi:hypothetical protein
MRYRVLITQRAQQEAQASHDWWAEHRSAEQAARWYDAFLKSANSLERDPERWALAAEGDRFPYQIRQLNFGLGQSLRTEFSTRSAAMMLLSCESAILHSKISTYD